MNEENQAELKTRLSIKMTLSPPSPPPYIKLHTGHDGQAAPCAFQGDFIYLILHDFIALAAFKFKGSR